MFAPQKRVMTLYEFAALVSQYREAERRYEVIRNEVDRRAVESLASQIDYKLKEIKDSIDRMNAQLGDQ